MCRFVLSCRAVYTQFTGCTWYLCLAHGVCISPKRSTCCSALVKYGWRNSQHNSAPFMRARACMEAPACSVSSKCLIKLDCRKMAAFSEADDSAFMHSIISARPPASMHCRCELTLQQVSAASRRMSVNYCQATATWARMQSRTSQGCKRLVCNDCSKKNKVCRSLGDTDILPCFRYSAATAPNRTSSSSGIRSPKAIKAAFA